MVWEGAGRGLAGWPGVARMATTGSSGNLRAGMDTFHCWRVGFLPEASARTPIDRFYPCLMAKWHFLTVGLQNFWRSHFPYLRPLNFWSPPGIDEIRARTVIYGHFCHFRDERIIPASFHCSRVPFLHGGHAGCPDCRNRPFCLEIGHFPSVGLQNFSTTRFSLPSAA